MMPFKKPCRICGEYFTPLTRSGKLCLKCRADRRKVAVKNMKKTNRTLKKELTKKEVDGLIELDQMERRAKEAIARKLI